MDRSELVAELARTLADCLKTLDLLDAHLPAVHVATAVDALQNEFQIGQQKSVPQQLSEI